ncbi:MAG: PQQ-dependent sugar dehydrogenase [Gemmataceae bacterium]
MRLLAVCLTAALAAAARADAPKPLVKDLPNAAAVAVGPDGRAYVAVHGERVDNQSGAIVVVENGKAKPVATGLNRPSGLVPFRGGWLVTGLNALYRVGPDGKVQTLANESAFKREKVDLSSLSVDEGNSVYVLDTFEFPTLYRIDVGGGRGPAVTVQKVTKLAGLHEDWPNLRPLEGLATLRQAVRDHVTSMKVRNDPKLVMTSMVARSCNFNAFTWDHFGRLFFAFDGAIHVVPRPGLRPVEIAKARADAICLGADGKALLALDGRDGTVTAIPCRVPGHEVDTTPLPLETEVVFADLDFAGWKGVTDAGKTNPLRPIVLTHAGDGTSRIFVATQHGVIHVFDPKAAKTKVFLDISDKVRYDDRTNEEGFLGLAFHPDYKTNGEFYCFYTDKTKRLENIVVRFRVSKTDPDRADPASEEELIRISHKYWNHDGGTVVFGPDKMLYIALGDGGSANDPDDNGQNLNSLLGKILRIDVGKRGGSTAYAIPSDNPFIGKADTRPEIWAYGLRNVWRMDFDRKTGRLWAADVGQNIYEEIDLIEKGGNYGWNRREATHPFGPKASGPDAKYIEPIWEYHHDIGKSITGGFVYHGKALPELDGHYLYADYVSGRIWALKYDDTQKRVVANRPIKDKSLPIMSFGEDAAGEAYLLTYSANGQGIHKIVRSK